MPITHDGIQCGLAPSPLWLSLGLLFAGAGGWLVHAGSIAAGVGLVVIGGLVLLNQKATRRVRVLATKLLVEDERLLRALLIGPARSRIGWEKVREVRIEGNHLRLDTDGAPFLTAQGASRADLEALESLAQKALVRFRADAASEPA